MSDWWILFVGMCLVFYAGFLVGRIWERDGNGLWESRPLKFKNLFDRQARKAKVAETPKCTCSYGQFLNTKLRFTNMNCALHGTSITGHRP